MAISKTQKAEMMCMISEMRLNDELMIGFSRLFRFIYESDLFSSRAYKIAQSPKGNLAAQCFNTPVKRKWISPNLP